MTTDLPDGWTIERVRTESGDAEAELLTPDRSVTVEQFGRADRATLRPEVILSFHDLYLVRAGDEWFMGGSAADGSIVCWASYGPDLGEAIRGL